MAIRKKGEKVKGTTRVSFGDRKLMTRLWIADKTSRYEKRRATRAMNIKEKEFFSQCPSVRAETGYKAFKKDMKALPKKFQLPEEEEDEDIAAIDTASRYAWYRLVLRHNSLQDDNQVLEEYLRDNMRGAAGKTKLAEPDQFTRRLFAEFGNAEECTSSAPASWPKSIATAIKITEAPNFVQKTRSSAELFPLLFTRRNMRLVYQYRRLTRRSEQLSDTVTSSTSHCFTQHMFYGAHDGPLSNERFAFAKPEEVADAKTDEKRHHKVKDGDFIESEYSFSCGGLHATDGAWPLIDGNAAPSRPMVQPRQWNVIGDSVTESLASKMTVVTAAASSTSLGTATAGATTSQAQAMSSPPLSFNFLSAKRRHSSSGGGGGDEANRSSGDIGGFGFVDEQKQRQYLKTEQRNNSVVYRHAYEVERQATVWTTCQRCRMPVHTCDMLVRESLGVEDVACFHPQCLQAVNDAHQEQLDAAAAREKLVSQFTPLVVADQHAVRQSVRKQLAAPVLKAQRERRAFVAKSHADAIRQKASLQQVPSTQEEETNLSTIEVTNKRKRPLFDSILDQMMIRAKRPNKQ